MANKHKLFLFLLPFIFFFLVKAACRILSYYIQQQKEITDVKLLLVFRKIYCFIFILLILPLENSSIFVLYIWAGQVNHLGKKEVTLYV